MLFSYPTMPAWKCYTTRSMPGMPLAVGGDPEARHGIMLDSQLYSKEKRGEDRNGALAGKTWHARKLLLYHHGWICI